MNKKYHPKNWRNILWREWRYTDDEEYAERLHYLLAHRISSRWMSAFSLVMLGGVWGALIGLLIGLAAFFGAPELSIISREMTLAISIAGTSIIGACLGIFFIPFLNKRFIWTSAFFGLNIGIIIGLFTFFFGRSIPDAVFVGTLVGAFGVWFFSNLTHSDTKDLTEISKTLRQRSMLLNYLLPYKHRRWYFWWSGRPKILEVETALRQARKERPKIGMTWSQSLRRLEYPNEYPASLDEFLVDLDSDRWIDRFIARHRLFDYGGEAVQPLLSIISRKPDLQSEGTHILKNIGWETNERLAQQAPDLVCPNCLTRCHAHKAELSWQPGITFYCCRTCQQSREFLECPQGIVAVLDAGWTEIYRLQNDLLQVNWSAQRRLFDFDRVEIIQATDEDVERFAMQVGNDTDPVRQPRYAQMHCLIAPDCQLSENSLRILQNFFGEVERQEISQRTTANIEDTELLYGENMADEESDAYLQGTA